MVSKGLELFSFEFSLPRSSVCVACPNCGYQICNTILHKFNLSKTIILVCCGSVIYWNYFKDRFHLISLFSSAKNLIQNALLNIFSSSLSSPSNPLIESSYLNQSNTTNVLNQCYQYSSNSIRNQLIVNNNYEDQLQDSNDFSSLNLSPLNSIGTGTLAKLETMLDEVAEIKMYVNDSCNELQWFNTGSGSDHSIQLHQFCDHRISDSEFTTSLPSLEWDLNDVNFYGNDDGNTVDDINLVDRSYSEKTTSFIHNQNRHRNSLTIDSTNNIDTETLSQIIFNKDFEFKDERFFRVKKQFVNLKQRLKLMSKTQAQQQQRNYNPHSGENNLNSYNYRTNRDSAFFEDIQ